MQLLNTEQTSELKKEQFSPFKKKVKLYEKTILITKTLSFVYKSKIFGSIEIHRTK